MDLNVEEVIEGLFSDEAYERPSDQVNPEELEMKLPEWFDEKKFNQGRRFHKDFLFAQSISMILGLIVVMAIPSILSVLLATRRSNSQYTAFKRYWSTFLHISAWTDHDLKPGSVSWQSLYTVRSRHVKAGRTARLKGQGTVSQRDLAFTLFGFAGFTILKPAKLCIRQLQPGDWEAFNHFWAVIGSMIGLEDRYNICRKNYDETRKICQVLQDRVFTPCLENVPEYFEHAAHVMTVGLSSIHPAIEHGSLVFITKYLSNVPGYIYTEEDRITLQDKLKIHLNGKGDTGVETSKLMDKCPINFLPKTPPRVLYLQNYETIEDSPSYKRIPLSSKFKMAALDILLSFYSTNIGRYILNLHFSWYVLLGTYLPYVTMWRYGIREAYVSLFKEGPVDDTAPKPNSMYYKTEQKPWYVEILSLFWSE